jgi:hypothetical protein
MERRIQVPERRNGSKLAQHAERRFKSRRRLRKLIGSENAESATGHFTPTG